MATFGSFSSTASVPSSAFNFSRVNSANVVASKFTMADIGTITSLSVYMDGDTASATTVLGLWDGSTGALLAQTNSFSAPQGAESVGGQAWHTANLTVPFFNNTPGRTFWIGFWRNASQSAVWSVTASGHFSALTDTGAIGSFAGATQDTTWGFVAGQIGAFATYTPGGVLVENASFVGVSAIKAWNGSAWVNVTAVKIWDGSAWQQIF